MDMDFAARFADHACRSRFGDLPESVVEKSKNFILDTIGAAIAGSSAEGINAGPEWIRETGETPQATVTVLPNFPDIPAVAETVPGFELNSWYGMMVPAGTPRAIVNRLQQELAAALKKSDVIEWMKQNGLDPVGSTPEEHAAHIRSELAKWAKAVKDAKISAN